MQNMMCIPGRTLSESGCANAGAVNHPAYDALAPFLPTLPEFLEGVTLAVKHEYPCSPSFRRLTDVLEFPNVDLDILLNYLAEHLAATNEPCTGES